MLETVREFGAEQLEIAGEAEETRKRHAIWIRDLAERARPELMGFANSAWVAQFEAEVDNIRAALRWAMEQPEAETAQRIAFAVGWYWNVTGQLSEGLRLGGALVGASEARHRSKRESAMLILAGWLTAEHGDVARANAYMEEARPLARATGNRYYRGPVASGFRNGRCGLRVTSIKRTTISRRHFHSLTVRARISGNHTS